MRSPDVSCGRQRRRRVLDARALLPAARRTGAHRTVDELARYSVFDESCGATSARPPRFCALRIPCAAHLPAAREPAGHALNLRRAQLAGCAQRVAARCHARALRAVRRYRPEAVYHVVRTARRRAVPGALDALTRQGALDPSSHGLRIVGNAAIAPERGTLHGLPHRSRRHRHAVEEITSATALVLYEPPGGER
jgi:hypothetical protein